ncbi:4Fe-4S binding protein [Odoribacter sp. OttesenSCG-928-J03]|nr:4Fe-4S binding protein [Odoribacter sp. OttesenSCG-928-J03]MDL2282965.1 4Fe-4S binding protein [Odoribacter sp. OttesenSCG-928-G04]
MYNYIKRIVVGIFCLFQGMYISMLNMLRPKVTEQYPENRGKKEYFERFRGLLVMPHDENNQHKCTACGICMNSCPNGTIRVVSKMVTDEMTGKDKKVLDQYQYDLGSCTFCALCTSSCPFGAIEWSNAFEHSLFTRDKLNKQLNREGSTLMVKKSE